MCYIYINMYVQKSCYRTSLLAASSWKKYEKVTNQKMIKATKPLSEQCSGGICSTSTVVDRGGGMRRSH